MAGATNTNTNTNTNPNTNSNSNSNPNSKPVNAKEFYGYLYEPNKTPSKVLDALLRAIGQYIVSRHYQISLMALDRGVWRLTSWRLSAF